MSIKNVFYSSMGSVVLYPYTDTTLIGTSFFCTGLNCGQGSSDSVGIGYWLDGPEIESRWERDFPPVQTGPGSHPASSTIVTGSFLGVKSGRSVKLTPHPFQCRGQERVELYLYSPYGPYGLYRASVPVQGCTLPLPSSAVVKKE